MELMTIIRDMAAIGKYNFIGVYDPFKGYSAKFINTTGDMDKDNIEIIKRIKEDKLIYEIAAIDKLGETTIYNNLNHNDFLNRYKEIIRKYVNK